MFSSLYPFARGTVLPKMFFNQEATKCTVCSEIVGSRIYTQSNCKVRFLSFPHIRRRSESGAKWTWAIYRYINIDMPKAGIDGQICFPIYTSGGS